MNAKIAKALAKAATVPPVLKWGCFAYNKNTGRWYSAFQEKYSTEAKAHSALNEFLRDGFYPSKNGWRYLAIILDKEKYPARVVEVGRPSSRA